MIRIDHYRPAILAALKGVELTSGELVDKTGVNFRRLRELLPRMVKAGEIVKIPTKSGTHHIYALPEYAADLIAIRAREVEQYRLNANLRKAEYARSKYVRKRPEEGPCMDIKQIRVDAAKVKTTVTRPCMDIKRVLVDAAKVKTTVAPQTWCSILGV